MSTVNGSPPALTELFEQALDPPPAAGPSLVPRLAEPAHDRSEPLPGVLPVSRAVVVELQRQASAAISSAQAGSTLTGESDRRQLGLSVVNRTVSEWAARYAATDPLTEAQEALLRQAVYDELFRAGPLQPLLDDARVENITINGSHVQVTYADRPPQTWPAVADSDRALVDLVNRLARMSGQGERALTPATPNLNMRLPDGSRLAASYWITPTPQIVIRRHRTRGTTIDQHVQWGSIDSTLAAFLKAAVRARKNLVIVGAQNAGKTSLLRALAREIPAGERVGTLESEFELYLHEEPDGLQVVPFEARESNGERGPDGRLQGEITLSDLFPQMLRMSLRRILVGEVRSREVLPMLQAMSHGEGGSMCTLHAATPQQAIERLVTLCLEAGIGMTEGLAYRLIAQAVHLVVFLRYEDETTLVDARGRPGRQVRFVSHVMELAGIGEHGRPSVQMVFAPRESDLHREPRAVPHGNISPRCLADLERAGFDRRLLTSPWGSWQHPLETVVPL